MTDEHAPPAYPFGTMQTLDLEPEYAQLLEARQLTRVTMPVGGEAWLATSYDHVKQVLSDPCFSRSEATRPDVPRLSPEMLPRDAIMAQDPPQHTRLRRLIAKAFTARRVETFRPRTQEIVDELLDTMVAAGEPANLSVHLSSPLPLIVICELLGVPLADRELFTAFGEVLTSRDLTTEQIGAERTRFERHIAGLVAEHRDTGADDLLGALIAARDEGEPQRRRTDQPGGGTASGRPRQPRGVPN